MTSPPSPAESRQVDLGSPPDLVDWEKVNGSPRRDETNQAWEREIKDDECMRDAPPPPPPRSRTNSVSDGAAAPREAVELCGVAMLLQHIMTNPPPGAEPAHLAAFWAEPDVPAPAGAAPSLDVGELHDFMFRLFTITGHTPECSVLAFMLILRMLSFHPHLRITPRNCKRLLLCGVMVAQKNHDDAPLRNVDFATAWGHVLPGERPVSVERVGEMERVLLDALGFDLYVPRDQYEATIAELHGVVASHGAGVPGLPAMLRRHAEFLASPPAVLPWVAPPRTAPPPPPRTRHRSLPVERRNPVSSEHSRDSSPPQNSN